MPSGWDWPAISVALVLLAVQQLVTHKRWKALIDAIRDKNRRRNDD